MSRVDKRADDWDVWKAEVKAADLVHDLADWMVYYWVALMAAKMEQIWVVY